jgi:cell division protein FtsB
MSALRGRWKAVVATAAVIAAGFVFVAWAKMDTVQLTYRIDDLADEEERLAEEQRRLRARLATLRTPAALEELAPKLGLVKPGEGQIVVVPEDAAPLEIVESEAALEASPTAEPHPADEEATR